jgi:uncharacterized Ntn-hydrolase superfamily protein
MKKIIQLQTLLIIVLLLLPSTNSDAQDTFSIVAVDTVTGEIGSAGASCIGAFGNLSVFNINSIVEGIGCINTQAYWHPTNQQNANVRMLEGLSPQEIIDWLVANDVEGNPAIRQYGIVDLTRNGESAAYTGINCDDYKNHITGPGYAIQGNILLGQIILDTMHTTFLNTQAPLADRLMAALQAAKIVGADTRCATRNTSSIGGFVKVVRIGDGSTPYLQIVVPDTPEGTDPIDLLKGMFEDWKSSLSTVIDPFLSQLAIVPDTLPANGSSQAVIAIAPKNNSDTLLASGKEILLSNTGAGTLSTISDLANGIYEATITSPSAIGNDTISAKVISGSDTVTIFWKAVVTYVNPTSVEEKNSFQLEFHLYQNYPQPFNPSTTIDYQIPFTEFVSLKVYDVLGKEVATLVNEEKPAGSYEVEFNGTKLSSGVYLYKMQAGSFTDTKKLILVK